MITGKECKESCDEIEKRMPEKNFSRISMILLVMAKYHFMLFFNTFTSSSNKRSFKRSLWRHTSNNIAVRTDIQVKKTIKTMVIIIDLTSSGRFVRRLFRRWWSRTPRCNFSEFKPRASPRPIPRVFGELCFRKLSSKGKWIFISNDTFLRWNCVPRQGVTLWRRKHSVQPIHKVDRDLFISFDKIML